MGMILLPAELMFTGFRYDVSFSRVVASAFTTAQPMLLVPRSSPKIFFIMLLFFVVEIIFENVARFEKSA